MALLKSIPDEGLEEFKKYLISASALSSLFGKSKAAFIHSRLHEFLFCLATKAFNVSRKDLLVDAISRKTGFALKTFSTTSYQKIGEFGAYANRLKKTNPPKKSILNIISLYNKRIEQAKKNLGLKKLYYHCLFRKKGFFIIYDEDLEKLDSSKIKDVYFRRNKTSLMFSHNNLKYSFYFAKNVLQRKFIPPERNIISIPCDKRIEPSCILQKVAECSKVLPEEKANMPFVILPLWSTRNLNNKEVKPGSSINAWNARGRPRDLFEVYIPIPRSLHEPFKGILPPRYKCFYLHLPNGEIVESVRKQEHGKAFGSTTEKYLGIWILSELRKRLPKSYRPFEKPFTYPILKLTGFDSVRLTRFNKNNYFIRLERNGSYERFLMLHGLI